MAKTKKNSAKTLEEKRRQKKEAERVRRDRIKKDPVAYEEAKRKERERYHKRKEEGKVKTITEISNREQRKRRKTWKVSAAKYRKKQKQATDNDLAAESPPLSSDERQFDVPCLTPLNSKEKMGRKKVRRDRAKAYRKISHLERELKMCKRQLNRYKSKYFREMKRKENKDSPNTKVKNLTKGLTLPNKVKRKLVFNEALMAQIKLNYNRVRKEKVSRVNFVRCMVGKIIKKYRGQKHMKHILSYKVCKTAEQITAKSKANLQIEHVKKDIEVFLESDFSSKLCPGKRDTITRKGHKKQKRYLNNSLKNLHRQFMKNNGSYCISYATFCKLRPFWVVQPKATERETCLCILHENVRLLVSKLKQVNIISENTPDEVCHNLCCDSEFEEKCLERTCVKCKDKKISYSNLEQEEIISYHKWILKKETITTKGLTKTCHKYTKELLKCSMGDLVQEFELIMPKYMTHVCNINHQYKQLTELKKNLTPNEIVVHMDFSENYECKYFQEIQSFHFGGSREQTSLHTVMVYYNNGTSVTQSKAFCTLSDSLRHDPVAICAHLNPIFEQIKLFVPNLKHIHFLSDGPSTQYRNRKMFKLLGTHIPDTLPSVQTISWNYTEAGHGKGAPDGLGGTLKRTADTLVAQGNDIQNFNQLVTQLKNIVKGIELIAVPEGVIESFNHILEDEPKPFKGTFKTHQVTWARRNAHMLYFRRLSCFTCQADDICSHYSIGNQTIHHQPFKSSGRDFLALNTSKTLRYVDVYGHSDSEENPPPATLLNNEQTVKVPTIEESLVNNYVVVQFTSKKSVKHYVGLVLEEDNSNLMVKFMRMKKDKSFFFPEKEDISLVELCDIKQVLDDPMCNRRQNYTFKNLDFGIFSYIC